MCALFKIEKPFVFTALIYVWGSSPNVNQSFFVCWMIKIWGSWLHRNRQSASQKLLFLWSVFKNGSYEGNIRTSLLKLKRPQY